MRHPPRPFRTVDVFSARPGFGNPVAVVHAAEGLDDAALAAFARWTNLSETAFLLAPADPRADYRVRIFTPGGELPFAGHPTLGSAHAWLEAGGRPKVRGEVVQECPAGLVSVRDVDGRLAFAAPPCRETAPAPGEAEAAAAALGLLPGELRAAAWLDNGPRWLALEVAEAARVRALVPDLAAVARVGKVGVVGFQDPETADGDRIEVRAFAPGLGVPEDPATGSLNAGLAGWLGRRGLVPDAYAARQGTALRREARLHARRIEGRWWIGGDTVTVVAGAVGYG